MNRWLMAGVLGLMVTACAEGVDDPLPEPDPPVEQRQATPTTFANELPSDQSDKLSGVDVSSSQLEVPRLVRQPLPLPSPNPSE